MTFNPNLNYGENLTNEQMYQLFKCSNAGGMRRSKETNTLVLISDHTKTFYNDRWEEDELLYTGMGLSGNQSLDYMQNKTLFNSNENRVDVHLFEVNKPTVYTYIGKVILSRKPFQEEQVDINGNRRKVWIFPLKLEGSTETYIPEKDFLKRQEETERKLRNLDSNLVEQKAKTAKEKPKLRSTISRNYERDPYVAEYSKRRANGYCQLCSNKAPFLNKDGSPFLEIHHIKWLSEGGKDSIDNTVALCPNCHRKMHILGLKEDIDFLISEISIDKD